VVVVAEDVARAEREWQQKDIEKVQKNAPRANGLIMLKNMPKIIKYHSKML
jgi:hypothetical protein